MTLISHIFLLIIYVCNTEMFPWRLVACCRPLARFLGISSGHTYPSACPSYKVMYRLMVGHGVFFVPVLWKEGRLDKFRKNFSVANVQPFK